MPDISHIFPNPQNTDKPLHLCMFYELYLFTCSEVKHHTLTCCCHKATCLDSVLSPLIQSWHGSCYSLPPNHSVIPSAAWYIACSGPLLNGACGVLSLGNVPTTFFVFSLVSVLTCASYSNHLSLSEILSLFTFLHGGLRCCTTWQDWYTEHWHCQLQISTFQCVN